MGTSWAYLLTRSAVDRCLVFGSAWLGLPGPCRGAVGRPGGVAAGETLVFLCFDGCEPVSNPEGGATESVQDSGAPDDGTVESIQDAGGPTAGPQSLFKVLVARTVATDSVQAIVFLHNDVVEVMAQCRARGFVALAVAS